MEKKAKVGRRKKITTPPGKSASLSDFGDENNPPESMDNENEEVVDDPQAVDINSDESSSDSESSDAASSDSESSDDGVMPLISDEDAAGGSQETSNSGK